MSSEKRSTAEEWGCVVLIIAGMICATCIIIFGGAP